VTIPWLLFDWPVMYLEIFNIISMGAGNTTEENSSVFSLIRMR